MSFYEMGTKTNIHNKYTDTDQKTKNYNYEKNKNKMN